jgi:hypothetical protein
MSMIKLRLTIYFFIFIATMLNGWFCYERWRNLWPEEAGDDLISRIQGITRIAPDPTAKISDECAAAWVQLKHAIFISIGTMLVGGMLIFSLKFFGVEIPE